MLDIQEKLLVLLKEINTICEKHNITWFLMYGTLLGAIRHNGFIPWDDDADIVMTHENWVKFKKVFSDEALPERSLTSIDVDASQYGQSIARYHDISQEILIKYNTIFNMKNGIYVDILILDNFPDHTETQKEYHRIFLDFCELAHKRYCPSTYLPGKSNYMKKIGLFLLKNRQKELQKYIDKLSSIGTESSKSYIQRYCINHIYEKKLLSDVLFVKFEDTLLPVPSRYYEILCLQYGESWMYVPHNKTMHDDNIFSEKISKEESIVQQFHKRRNGIAHQLAYLGSKLVNTTYTPDYRDWKLSTKSLASEFVQYSLSAGQKMDQESRILFYLAFQTNVWFVGRYVSAGWWNWYNHTQPTLIGVDDALLSDSLEYLLEHNELQMACMLLQAFVHSGRKKTPELVKLEELSSAIKRANAALCAADHRKALLIAKQALSSWPTSLLLWRVCIAAGHAIDIKGFTLPENLPDHITRDPEIALVRAEIALRDYQLENALHHLYVCSSGTRNGLVLRRLLKVGENLFRLLPLQRADLLPTLQKTIAKATESLGEQTPNWASKNDLVAACNDIPKFVTASEKIVNTVQKQARTALQKQYALLSEVGELCEACNVRYYLFGNALRFALLEKRFDAEPARLAIVLDAHECNKLLSCYKNHIRPHRYLECPSSNPDFPEFALYYGDSRTLELNASSYGFLEHHGIHIDVRILTLKEQSFWRKRLRTLIEATWGMEHGRMPATFGRLTLHIIFSMCRFIFGKRHVADWLFRRIFLQSRRLNAPSKKYQILWKKKFLSLPIKWFNGCQTGMLEDREFPVPAPKYQPALLKTLYGSKWNSIALKPSSTVDPFHLISSEYSYDDFLAYLKNSSCDIDRIWKHRIHLMRFGWFRVFFLRKLVRDWNYLQFLNDRYRMYKAVLPLRQDIIHCFAEGDIKKQKKLMNSPVMKTCMAKTIQYLKQGVCFNFDSEIFNIVIEQLRSKGMSKKVKQLLRLNKKQKYPKITRKDVMEEESPL